MELSPTLRAQLDVLEPYLDDPAVQEILVAGPDRVFVTRCGQSERVDVVLPERQIRALADRVVRALGSGTDRQDVRIGRLSDDFEASVVGGPRAERCPVIRVRRLAAAVGTLRGFVEAGAMGPDIESQLAAAIAERSSIVIVGPFGAPRATLLAGLAAAWRGQGRVVALDDDGGPLARGDSADLVLPAGVGTEAMLATAADVFLAVDPTPRAWAGLLTCGRPFVTTLEAPGAAASIERMIASALTADTTLSRSAAEALVLAAVGWVVDLGPSQPMWVRGVGQPILQDGHVRHAGRLEGPPQAPAARPAAASARPARAPEVDALDLDAGQTSAFPAAELVEELSKELSQELEQEAAARRTSPDEPSGAPPHQRTRPAKDPAASAIDPEQPPEYTSRADFGLDLGPDDDEQDQNTAPLRRRAAERMATVTGPPQPSEVADHVARALDDLGLDSSVTGLPSLEDDLMTAHAVAPPDLDPFETQDSQFEPSPMDSTQAAEVGEMVIGDGRAARRGIPKMATVAQPDPGGDDEWDEDAPSEVMVGPLVLPLDPEGDEPDDGPFENEKTPVAPLFDASGNSRASRRPRRRPRSVPVEDDAPAAPSSGAADDIGDPTRRRDPPDRPRGARRRTQRDRS